MIRNSSQKKNTCYNETRKEENMELVTKLNEARYVTHNGTMHADEVFATAFLD